MELHKAIRNIVETDGKEIVKDVRLVNILSDFRAFDTIPASKYILRAVIADGYAQKLLAIGDWNTQSENLCNQFVASTGFQGDFANMVFLSLAYGLGFINQIQTMTNPAQQPQNSSPQKPTQKLTKKEQREAFLLSKVVFGNDIKKEIGVEISNLSFVMREINGDREFEMNYEISGKLRSPKIDVSICMAIYDNNNSIKLRDAMWFGFYNEFSGFTVDTHNVESPIPIEDISKICIFSEKTHW